jgi:enoyl-CoA hydratase
MSKSPSENPPRTTYEVGAEGAEAAPEGVALLRLDRPEARGAMDTLMLEEMLGHLAAARDDDAVRVLVLSSTDHMGLSAGADVREELDSEGRVRRMQLFADLYDELTGFAKPTVAACHGACVGGGAEVAIACDLRIGGSNLRLRFPGGALGVPVGPARLVTLCGLSVAKYLLLTGKEIDAEMALRWGLVHKVAPAAATEDAALQLASQVAANPPEAVARLKAMLHEWDGVVERSADEGRGQVEWQRSGPGLPYATEDG